MKPPSCPSILLRFALALSILLVTDTLAQQRGATRTGAGGTGAGMREYQNSTMVGEAMITSDPETRRLIVITDEETNEHISKVISNLDQPKPQVLIKVVFLEVTHRKGLDFGAEAQYTSRGSSATNTIGSSFFSGLLGAPLGGGFYQLAGEDVEVTVRALATMGNTEVLSRPSILARNNQQATIIVGEEIPIVTSTRFDTAGNEISTYEYREIGIILRVTPFISGDGMVEMIVSPEISNRTGEQIPISGGENPTSVPVIAKRGADTVVVTPNGKTVVIGGLMENQKTENDRKVPILGDIPGLGYLFKRKTKTSTKTELLIFLTPYVVGQPDELARMTSSETERTELAPKVFSNSDVERYLDGLPLKSTAPAETGKKKRK